MARFDSVVVGEDWISEHYLASDARSGTFTAQVLGLRKTWEELEAADKTTPRSGLRTHATEMAKALADLGDSRDPTAVRTIHALQRRMLGLDRPSGDWVGARTGADIVVPDAVVHPTPEGPSLVILEAQPVPTIEDALDASDDGAGRLLTPATIDGKSQPATAEVVSTMFLADEAPPFVLIQAGRWAVLAERTRWPEGRWLAVDLGLVAERRDVKRAGEIEHVAALLGRDTLLPDDTGTALWTTILAESVQHTEGVSKDLREGIRLSVEIIANEVIRRRRAQGLPVEHVEGLAADLTRQSLRFLYRILFLLYAEASPELGVLPAQTEEYQAGYGLDRLRELTLVDLASQRSRTGTHLYESLRRLFDLVDAGHDSDDVPFHALRADLFSREATSLIVEVELGNEAVQQVLRHLLLSKARKGQDRGFISYAELGINQLGAVYEGLMAYSGFIADTDLYEVAPGGNPEKGTWVLPADRADHGIAASDFVRTEDPATGEPTPVLHRQGTFVYRLASRERQQSASYYTPEVLTRSVVKHSLAELLDADGTTTPARDMLRLTICEPALGSGAFAIEAVRQLATVYLERRQAELGQSIAAEDYPAELQKVKAYLALHQVYGVDLNATAVELAEVSLWLDTMHAGLQAPWFGLHLRRGNSLIGARRAVYSPSQHLTKKAWLKNSPQDMPLHAGGDVGAGVHHFLLPAQGWGAIADTAEAKTYAPEARERVHAWRRAVRVNPTKEQKVRLGRLARRVETLWGFARRRLEIAEAEIRRHIDVWGADDDLPEATGAVSREQIEAALHDENGAYRRLRRVMDAWCALWSWPVTTEVAPPGWDDWLAGLETVLGLTGSERRTNPNQQGLESGLDWEALDDAETVDLGAAQAMSIEKAKQAFPWLAVTERIAAEQGYFHWELDFAPVFENGGFDLQVGNPPWVRPDWDEATTLAEQDPWWQLANKPAEHLKRERRERTLDLPGALNGLLDERALQIGTIEHLGSGVDRPVLRGLRPDSYRGFMERTWRSMNDRGIVGLIHPESHFTEARAGGLRRETYRRLRRHFQFRNELRLFEVHHTTMFGLHIYGFPRKDLEFVQASSLYHSDTIDRSYVHDGSGDTPGIKDDQGEWDIRPHAERIIRVDEDVLARWAALIDEAGTPAAEARMLYPVNRASANVLDKIALAPRLGDLDFEWTSGWNEATHRYAGYFEGRYEVPSTWEDVILQGPHLTVANPSSKQPNDIASRNNLDWSEIDLEQVGVDFIPRTNYQRAKPYPDYIAAYPKWNERPSTEYFRLAWRRMANSANVRTLHAAIVPPGPAFVGTVLTLGTERLEDIVIAAGIWASLPSDFLVKAAGASELKHGFVRRIPHIRHHELSPQLMVRTLRLNCLVQPYAPLWEELFDSAWQKDAWVPGIGTYAHQFALGDVEPTWSWDTPLRRDADRRQALVEIDAIVAVMLDMTADELATIYRTQFPVLQKYERDALYDAHGRQVPRELAKEYRKRDGDLAPGDLTLDGRTYALPFSGVDREADLRTAHAHFSRIAESANQDTG